MTASDSTASDGRFRRILMALDSASEDLAAVDAVAALARRLHAELFGLYVEDIDLVRLAEHNQMTTFSTVTAGRPATGDQLRRALRLQTSRNRQAVETATARHRIKARFEVRQGRLVSEVLAEAGDADLVVVGWTGGTSTIPLVARRTPPAATARAVAESAGRSVLLLRPGARLTGPVLVAFDGSDAARHALVVAAAIADGDGGVLEVVLTARRLDDAEAWRREVGVMLSDAGLNVTCLDMPNAGVDDLCRVARRDHASLIVLAAGLGLLEGAATGQLLEGLGCSLLLVR